ncbi:MAG TPA: arogenate dehydrogenase [Cyanobacteria bacterium UBA11149]|nr:arogenate dehydrogenase [Cyanobacteria bacterium UBA11367]HBE60097.1 arogenate dehydrogenase [Cyanobacteria bacterium UBA11366]HBK62672.1 arogenate dehydrogenase [Cyanobacteria bacterium UBA11166]HBR73218.1 arogenate dehydrogenase [Cyanobacteria bacterium UBA11159]HBS71627.1 arogenate dehydrogenase [Cyanobacteria bacterium UBA11153]HBW90803.1 arogenate dehydrogenase [Cyanobacteria bacterium UBA11149]HCA97711.1 arogenate dehydrogenase [Cyanobacteria bacterium UBA9226]
MNIGIVGLGLIGGSLGLDLRARGHKVLGVSRHERTCQIAIERGAVDDGSMLLSILTDVDIVFICTPIFAIAPTVKQLIPIVSPDTIITDVGSVKRAVVEAVTPLWQNFVGGHPMAGKEFNGIEWAEAGLFSGNPYVLTPIETTPPLALQRLEEIVRSLTSNVYLCRPEDHDRAVAWISHLPVIVSAGLIDSCMSETDPVVLKLAQHLASSGFRDTSRVGGGNPELGVMMARYNRDFLSRSLLSYRQSIDRLIELVEAEDWQGLEKRLQQTHDMRSQFFS